ncbi:MAG: sugar kinase [Chromatiales bacterium]|jgi:2-dehydro-3-deoxygluconokinase|nr:sugar kinase [Chromatiales bacterium]
MPDLICMGEPLVEFNQQPDGRYLQGFGGDAANCAVAAARLGLDVALVTALGQDSFGDAIVAMLEGEGVSTDAIARDAEAPTGIYFVVHTREGHQFEYRRVGSAASLFGAERLPVALLGQSRALHVSGISQAISPTADAAVDAAIEAANGAGALVFYDTNFRARLWSAERARRAMERVLPRCTVALPGLEDARILTGLHDPGQIVDAYLGYGVRVVALTMGGDGVLVATADDRATIEPITSELVDATGAGDAFDGAFISHYLESCDAFAAANFANAAAALSVRGFGAIAPLPRRDQVDSLLALIT